MGTRKNPSYQGWVYVLHFDMPYHHARHYMGCTTHLFARLQNHANGHGARLTKVLHQQGIPWRLGALYQVPLTQMRRIERALKNNHQGPAYCELCQPRTVKPPGTRPYDTKLLTFPSTSKELQLIQGTTPEIPTVRTATPSDLKQANEAIRTLMGLSQEELGWIPLGRGNNLAPMIDNGQVTLAEINGTIQGYAIHSYNNLIERVSIQQVTTHPAHRYKGIATALVADLIANRPYRKEVTCKVRDDLPANEFWTNIGFTKLGSMQHRTSGHTLNQYTLQESTNERQHKHKRDDHNNEDTEDDHRNQNETANLGIEP